MEIIPQLLMILLAVFSILAPIAIIYWLYHKINYFLQLKEEQNDLLNEIAESLKSNNPKI
jgi:hypothetical protein